MVAIGEQDLYASIKKTFRPELYVVRPPMRALVPVAELKKPDLKIGSYNNTEDIQLAVDLIANGGIIGVQGWGVNGLLMRADNPDAIIGSIEIKEEDNFQKPFSAMMSTEHLAKLVDPNSIHPDARFLFENPAELKERVGAMCHVCAIIDPSRVHLVPPSIRSQDQNGQYWVYNFDPYGHKGMTRLTQALENRGITAAITSFNRKGQPEIADQQQAIALYREKEIRLYMADRANTPGKGSFAQWNASTNEMMRDGQIPWQVVATILGVSVSEPQKGVKYPHHPGFWAIYEKYVFTSDRESQLDLRKKMIAFLNSTVS